VQSQFKDADEAYQRSLTIDANNRVADAAKQGRSRIAQKTMRQAVGGGLRPDAVMFCLAALEKYKAVDDAEVQRVGFEIATLGAKGINPNSAEKRYRLRSMAGEFSGLELLCYMFVAWKRIRPDTDMGFDLSKEYAAALAMQQGRSQSSP
jgi:hypothetical protein